MNKKNFQKILLTVSTATILFFYTNANMNDSTISVNVSESKKVSDLLSGANLSSTAQSMLRSHKRFISSYIAHTEKVESCTALYNKDHFMISGLYVTYPNGSQNQGHHVYCNIKNGTVTESFIANVQDRTPACVYTDTCLSSKTVSKTIDCMSFGSKKTYCDVDQLFGVPELVKERAPGRCKRDETYGYDGSGLWVSHGCDGTFQVSFIPSPGVLNRLNYNLIESDPFGQDIFSMKRMSQTLKNYSTNLKNEKLIEKRTANLETEIKRKTINYFTVRLNAGSAADVHAIEKQLSNELNYLTQELIHYKKFESCSALDIYLSEKKIVPVTSNFFFYAWRESSQLKSLGSDNPYRLEVKADKEFCDYTQNIDLVGNRKIQDFSDSKHLIENINKMKNFAPIYNRFPAGQFGVNDGLTTIVKTTPYTTKVAQEANCPRVTKCVAKKDVRYYKNSPYSFISESDLGDQIYETNGFKFCFKKDEKFVFSHKNLLYGVKCFKNRNESVIQRKTFDHQYQLVEDGGAPPTQLSLMTTINSSKFQLQGETLTGCVSKVEMKKHFERNSRGILVGDDILGVSSRVVERTTITIDSSSSSFGLRNFPSIASQPKYNKTTKYYCIAPNQQLSFNDENLVAAYLISNPKLALPRLSVKKD